MNAEEARRASEKNRVNPRLAKAIKEKYWFDRAEQAVQMATRRGLNQALILSPSKEEVQYLTNQLEMRGFHVVLNPARGDFDATYVEEHLEINW